MSDKPSKPKRSHWASHALLWAGAIATVLYVSFALSQIDWSDFQSLKLNEKGDFLAGVFAPLAFLWLVLGFFQQGMELRNSSEALWAQMEELRSSVEQQENLVNATRDLRAIEAQIHAENKAVASRAAQPIFQLLHGGSRTDPGDRARSFFHFDLENAGAECSKVEVAVDGTVCLNRPAMPRGGTNRFNLKKEIHGDWSVEGKISYIDVTGLSGSQHFKIVQTNGEREIEQPEQIEPNEPKG